MKYVERIEEEQVEKGHRVEWRRRLPSVWCKWTPKLNLVVPREAKRSAEKEENEGAKVLLPSGRRRWDYNGEKVLPNVGKVSFADCFWLHAPCERSRTYISNSRQTISIRRPVKSLVSGQNTNIALKVVAVRSSCIAYITYTRKSRRVIYILSQIDDSHGGFTRREERYILLQTFQLIINNNNIIIYMWLWLIIAK